MFEYLTETVSVEQLQVFLSEKGLEGWRLHTCDEIRKGMWAGRVLVVMDRVARQEETEREDDGRSEGIFCKS